MAITNVQVDEVVAAASFGNMRQDDTSNYSWHKGIRNNQSFLHKGIH